MPQLNEIADALKQFGGDPQKAGSLASILGFQASKSPLDLLSSNFSPVKSFLNQRFGVNELYRAGGIGTETGSAGLYIAVLNEWGIRSTDRDRPRRRIARTLVEYLTQDARSYFIMVPNPLQKRKEAEFVLPRSSIGVHGEDSTSASVSTIRALIDLENPNRFHKELLQCLSISPDCSLLNISEKWQEAFSVERVTKQFYQEYAKVRNNFAVIFKKYNMVHPVVKQLSDDEASAWATRQMGRILFIWFLQAKGWLGYDGSGQGSTTYLRELWDKRSKLPNSFYEEMLLPLFFEAMATRHRQSEVLEKLGNTPYMNGGLFRRNQLEDKIHEAGEVTLPNDIFDPQQEMSVLGLLSRYRFTTRESTPDDQSVDPDPELLGRVFENLYQGDERHDTGTYYTPREIVHFMCREALDGYLRDTTSINQEKIEWLRRQVNEPDENKQPLPAKTEEDLIAALDMVRICDPAVGSGAFLLGMMQEIVLLRRGILYSKNHYVNPEYEDKLITDWKYRAVTWNLHGVDINPEAVDICQLRLWLSLVLDQKDPRNVEPLPNLDFRVIAGDSLVDRVLDIAFNCSLPPTYQAPMALGRKLENEEHLIKQWQHEFETIQDNLARLRELRENVAESYKRIIRIQLETELSKANDEAQLYSGLNRNKSKASSVMARVEELQRIIDELDEDKPFQRPFLWPVAFPDIFSDGGFDIVVANPPYIRQEKLLAEDQKTYELTFSDVFAGTADILVFFFARALHILRKDGWLAFITSNKYMRAAYGEGLRQKLSNHLMLCRVIDFGDLPLFEANGKQVAAYPAVLIGKKSNPFENIIPSVADLSIPIRSMLESVSRNVNPENVRWAVENLSAILEENGAKQYPQLLLQKEKQGWILEDPILVKLFNRIMSTGVPLSKYVNGRIYRGVTTGLNEAFVITRNKRNELIKDDPRSAEIIKPWLRGRDIKRWRADWAELYIIFTKRGTNIYDYPAIREHLNWWRRDLEPKSSSGQSNRGRKPGTYQWFEIQDSTDYFQEFSQNKIILNRFINYPTFTFDKTGYFHNDACYCIVGKPFIAAILNSNIGWWLLSHLCTPLQNGYLQLFIQFIEKVPIPATNPIDESNVSLLVQKLITNPQNIEIDSELQNTINYFYKLNDKEIRLINSWFERRNEALIIGEPEVKQNE